MAENPENNEPSSVEKASKPARTFASRFYLNTIFVLLALLIGMYVWKGFSERSLERKIEFQRTEMAAQQQEALDAQARDMLRLTASPLAWAVRGEMMRENLSQVDDYFREFVREEGVLSIFLIDREGKVVLATNRKLETQSADQVVSHFIQAAESVLIEKTDTALRMGIPIMSFNEKIGILVVDYEPLTDAD